VCHLWSGKRHGRGRQKGSFSGIGRFSLKMKRHASSTTSILSIAKSHIAIDQRNMIATGPSG